MPINSEVTFLHASQTTRQSVGVMVNGMFDRRIEGNHIRSSAFFNDSLEFQHRYLFREPDSDFPGAISILSDFDVDQLTVRITSNTNFAFASTQIELDFSNIELDNPDTLGEDILSNVQFLSLSSNSHLFDQAPPCGSPPLSDRVGTEKSRC